MVMVVVASVFGLTAIGATILGVHQSLTIERLREENRELRDTLRDAVDDLCDALTDLSESMQDEYDAESEGEPDSYGVSHNESRQA